MRYILFVFTFLSLNSFAQEKLQDSLLKQDFEILTTIVTELSPNLNTEEKETLKNYLNKRIEVLNGKSMSVIDFFKFLMDSKTNTKSDAHSSLSLSNEVLKELLTEKSVFFPIPIIIIDNQFVVNNENVSIPFGAIIYEINERPVKSIISDFTKKNSTFELHNIENSFDIIYLIRYGATETFNIKYKLPNSELTKTIQLEPIDINTREKLYAENIFPLYRESLKKTINTNYFEDSDFYYIQLNSFHWKDNEVKNEYDTFEDQFSGIFKNIKKINPKNVIIDLRYNMGGNMIIPSLFYSFIAKDDFIEDIKLRVPDFDLPYKDYIAAFENKSVNKEQIELIMSDFKKPFIKNNDYYEVNVVDNKNHKPFNKSYEGNVYLMIGGRTFSAATYYTALFKNNKRGKIIGEQIGGSHHNITAGKQVSYVLPNSKIRLNMPLGVFKFSQEMEINVPEEMILPDIQISDLVKYQYLLKKEDWDLKEIINLIDKTE